MLNQFLRFAAVGAVATAVHYAVMFSLVELTGLSPVFATLFGFSAGAVVSYSLNRVFTFNHRPAFGRGFVKFFAVVGVGALLNAAIVWFLTQRGLYYVYAQFVATGLVLIWNFFSTRFVVFREPQP